MPGESPSTTAVCPTHGLRFDPSQSSGCIRCRTQGERPAPSGPSRLPLLLGVLGAIALVAGGWFGWSEYTSAQERAKQPRFTREQVFAEAHGVHVEIYSAVWCPSCDAIKSFLDANHVPYQEHDIDKDKSARDHWQVLNPAKTIPVIDVEGTIIAGANEEPVAKALMAAAEKHLAAATATP